MTPTVTLHVVMSLDGFIAREDNTVGWMDSDGGPYEGGAGEIGSGPMPPIDCYVLGARTYEHALELGWPYGDTPTVVLTARPLTSDRPSVRFYSGDLERLVREELGPRFQHIWLVGGAAACRSFLKLNLVDEIRLMIAPVTLSKGLPLFGDTGGQQAWRLQGVAGYRNGYVGLWYRRITG